MGGRREGGERGVKERTRVLRHALTAAVQTASALIAYLLSQFCSARFSPHTHTHRHTDTHTNWVGKGGVPTGLRVHASLFGY